MKEQKKFSFDKRTVERYIEMGQITDADLKKHLQNVPDDAQNAEWVEMDIHDTEIADTVSEMDEPEQDWSEGQPE